MAEPYDLSSLALIFHPRGTVPRTLLLPLPPSITLSPEKRPRPFLLARVTCRAAQVTGSLPARAHDSIARVTLDGRTYLLAVGGSHGRDSEIPNDSELYTP
jgi:hypothetical protein